MRSNSAAWAPHSLAASVPSGMKPTPTYRVKRHALGVSHAEKSNVGRTSFIPRVAAACPAAEL